ncbi:hypothetical protein EF847_10260 [Actinobacteria bacterium YIM 96077]|uniref:Tyr recombinase domain-containing protein n=2 Tax=Phytoactinopolyspora halophila TaxID=1981511 RepID=A0A329QBK3_9ACTN|nr:hypothetical protein EF847_10260 [Actinobacteria bacterium YIM 96077]RAW09714.1 hypothetical protein DPM12_20365 [Phytoactinopolyspora halophila]
MLDDAVLRVSGKNDVRLVPLHDTTVAMLTSYAARRDRICTEVASSAFFVTRSGQRMQQRWVQQTFAKLLALAAIQTPPDRRRPRIHDLRHTFAVATLINWQRDGINVHTRLPVLSTYLGHSSSEATYWYLQARPRAPRPRRRPTRIRRRRHIRSRGGRAAREAAMTTLAPIFATEPVGSDRPGRRHHRRLSDPPGDSPREQPRHTQQPVGGDPLAVPLHRPARLPSTCT